MPWSLLVQRDACVVLHSHTMGEDDSGDRIMVESFDVRRAGDADVARLRYTRLQDETTSDAGDRELLPLQVGVSSGGVYLFDPAATDRDIAAALRKPPQLTVAMKPTRPTAKNGYFFRFAIATKKGPAVCLGKAIPRSLDICEDTCEGSVCVSPTGGIVLLEGTAAPGFGTFMQPGYELLAGP